LVALCALATFALRADTAQAQGDVGGVPLGGFEVNSSHDDCDNGPPSGRNNNDCCDNEWNGPPHSNNNDDCDDDRDDRDDCDRDREHDRRGNDCGCRDGFTSSHNRDRDRDCDRDDRDDCDRDWDRWHDNDRRDRCRCDDDRNHGRSNRDCDDDDGTITISKDTDPSGGGNFSFSGDLGSFSLSDGSSKSWQVSNGYYTVTEKESTNWELTSIVCSGSGSWTTDLNGNSVRIRITNGGNVSCEFNNDGPGPVVYKAPVVQPTPIIIFVPAPQPVVRAPEPPRVVEAPRQQAVAALPRTGYGPDAQEAGMNLALPLGAMGALLVAGAGYAAVRRVRPTD
jgi:hypothetical protein